MRRIRFGLASFSKLWYTPTQENWVEMVRKIEDLGYSSIFIPDHFGTFGPQWEPVATMAAIAAVTKRINVGSSVFSVDYRHPVVLAQASATIHMISNGRHELGIGAGWYKQEYEQLGIPFDSAATRIRRLEEAVEIIRSCWTNESTTYAGEHFEINDLPKSTSMAPGERPRILIGGGGRKMLGLAGRLADIANITTSIPRGGYDTLAVREASSKNLAKKVELIRSGAEGAGRDPADVELSLWTSFLRITDDPEPELKKVADRFGIPVDAVAEWPQALIGPADYARETIKRRHDELGIDYFIVGTQDFQTIESFAKNVIEPLT